MKRAVVVGAGLKGIVAAYVLAERGHRVTLIDQAKRIGGVHTSVSWDGFELDLGCHLFGNDGHESTRVLLDLMGQAARPVTPSIASVLTGHRTEGIECPDFTRLPHGRAAKALTALISKVAERGGASSAAPGTSQSLRGYLEDRFGVCAAELVEEASVKFLPVPASGLAASGFSALPMRRLKLTDDRTADFLKQIPSLDDVLLRSNAEDPMRFLPEAATAYEARCFYPESGGLGGFAVSAERRLRELRVDLALRTAVRGLEANGQELRIGIGSEDCLEADVVVWTSGWTTLAAAMGLDTALLSKSVLSVPMALYYFDVQAENAGPYHWLHNFDPDTHVLRASVPSRFGSGTAPEGRHYVCAEVPTRSDADLFNNPSEFSSVIWDEVVGTGVASGPLPSHHMVITTPTSYRFATANFQNAVSEVQNRLGDLPSLRVADEFNFGKSASVREIKELIADFE